MSFRFSFCQLFIRRDDSGAISGGSDLCPSPFSLDRRYLRTVRRVTIVGRWNTCMACSCTRTRMGDFGAHLEFSARKSGHPRHFRNPSPSPDFAGPPVAGHFQLETCRFRRLQSCRLVSFQYVFVLGFRSWLTSQLGFPSVISTNFFSH